MKKIGSLVIFLTWSLILSGCDKKSSGGGSNTTAKVVMDNTIITTTSKSIHHKAISAMMKPDIFKVKLIAFQLFEGYDSNNNVINASPIYYNLECYTQQAIDEVNHQISDPENFSNPGLGSPNGQCGVSSEHDSVVTQYFDLTRTSDLVNADLSSLPVSTNPGTFTHAEFAISGALDTGSSSTAKNIQWGMNSPAFSQEEYLLGNSQTTIALDTPIVINSGDAVQIKVSYDISESVLEMDLGDSTSGIQNLVGCYDGTTKKYCLVFPKLRVEAVAH